MTTKYFTVKEAANKITRISPKLLYKLIKEKRFPHLKIGSRILIPEDELEIWLEKNTHHITKDI